MAAQSTDNNQSQLEALLKEYSEIFDEKLGTISNIVAELKVKTNMSPKFYRLCQIPFALREAVTQELNRLESEGGLKLNIVNGLHL